MAVRMKRGGVMALIVVGVAGLFLGKTLWYDKLPTAAKKATEIGRVALPDAPEASLSGSAATELPVPKDQPAANGGSKIDWKIMAWNSQFGLMYANGGQVTMKNSLIDKAGLQINLFRQDDCNKSCADIVKFAKDYKANPQMTATFTSFMGDGMPYFFMALCKELEPLGPEYQPIGFYTMGKSYGEDKVMGPPEWKTNPQSALGKTCACVLRDGDMNILLKWAGDNSLKVNPDETSFDLNAINLIAASDFLDAPAKFITDYKEKRRLIVNGQKTSKDTIVGVDAFATWTPGDVNAAMKRGGVAVIASTKEYSSQMPNISITIKKWANDHRTDVENLIIALGTAGDQVRSFNSAKQFAAAVSAKVYAEQDPAYWLKYYNGTVQRDAQGLDVALGGSMAFNLSDAMNFFGLGTDRLDRYKIVYSTFGDIMSKMYPEIMPTYPEYSKVMDKSFLASVVSNHPELLQGKALTVQYAEKITSTVSSKSYQIQFEVGSAVISPASSSVLEEILGSAVVAEGLKVGVYGHTDNTGNPTSNMTLSESRAYSVKNYLMNRGLPNEEIEAQGFGDTQPIASNASSAGRAQNRRVQIVLGK
jgi:outer membrane protein OmpA-like peptidoglycan-associated protein